MESLEDSPVDEMILLAHIDLPGSYERRPKCLRLVPYRRLDDVPKLLMGDPTALANVTIPRKPRQRVEAATVVRPDGDHRGHDQQKRIDDTPQENVAEGKDVEAAGIADHEEEIDESRVNAAIVIQDAYRRHLDRKRTPAVRKIEAAYRRYLKRKNVVRKGIDATQVQNWELLRKKSLKMKWTKDSRYHLLFRLPLADILTCLDTIKGMTESEKKKANKRLNSSNNQDLDDVMDLITKIRCDSVDYVLDPGSNSASRKLTKKMNECQKKLSPDSKLHEKRSLKDLQQAVQEAAVIVEGLDDIPGLPAKKNRVRKRWDRGYKWIFEKEGGGAKGKKGEKPRLALEL